MTNFEKNELLALIEDYGNINEFFNQCKSDTSGDYILKLKEDMYEKIKELINKINQ